MKITGLETYCVAIPFIAPIFSAYGMSYPARLRTLNQLLADGLITQSEYDELRRKILAEL